jgi:hypothetical protein
MGELVDEGVRFGFTRFEAQDGARLEVIHGGLGTTAKAQAHFQKKLSEATKVLSQENKRDKEGAVVGIRAEVTFGPDQAKHTGYGILWTNGQDFYEITATSLDDARRAEKARS